MRRWVFLALTWLVAGCAAATLQGRWISIADQNTREGYERFVKEYPDSEEANEAKKRNEDPDYAFLATCRMGTQKAFQGFLTSYPSSDYASTARAYVEFLKETRRGDLNSYKRFISQHPDHPFVALAKVSLPVLWLKETGQKIGVVVRIHELTDKGLLGGGYGDPEKTRQGVWGTIKGEMEKEGIQAVLLDGLESREIAEEGMKEVVTVDYSEVEAQQIAPPISGPYDSPLANALHWQAVNTLSNLLYHPPIKAVSITVKGISDGVEYYTGFPSLSSSSAGRVNRVAALKAIGNHASPAGVMVALNPSLTVRRRFRPLRVGSLVGGMLCAL